ncbi:MAG TPA: 3-dehydroquinate synthase II, partial [Thermoplasmata archaeon]|nr:3-dehydroquinate synthase II [Thermoplasmata archaeon]
MTRERVTVAPTAASREARASIRERARRRGFQRFAVEETDPTEAAPGEVVLVRRGDALEILGGERGAIPIVSVRDPSDLDAALRTAPAGGVLAIEWTGDRVIPLENAIAAVARRFELWVFANAPSEVPGALGALEHGAQQVIVAVRSPEEVDDLEALLEGPVPTNLDWVVVPVATVR